MNHSVLNDQHKAFCDSHKISEVAFRCFSTLYHEGVSLWDCYRQAQEVFALYNPHHDQAHTVPHDVLTGPHPPMFTTPVTPADPGPGTCCICPKTVDKKDINRHVREHYMLYVCLFQDCSFTNTRKDRLEKHHNKKHPGYGYEGLAESSLRRLATFVKLGRGQYPLASIVDMHDERYYLSNMNRYGKVWERFGRDCWDVEPPCVPDENHGNGVGVPLQPLDRMEVETERISTAPTAFVAWTSPDHVGPSSGIPSDYDAPRSLHLSTQPTSGTTAEIDSGLGLPNSHSLDDHYEHSDIDAHTPPDLRPDDSDPATALRWSLSSNNEALDSIAQHMGPIEGPIEPQVHIPYSTEMPPPTVSLIEHERAYRNDSNKTSRQATADYLLSTDAPFSRSVNSQQQYSGEHFDPGQYHVEVDTDMDPNTSSNSFGAIPQRSLTTTQGFVHIANNPHATQHSYNDLGYRPIANIPPTTAHPHPQPQFAINHPNRSVHFGPIFESPMQSSTNFFRQSRASSRVANRPESSNGSDESHRDHKRKRKASEVFSRWRKNTWNLMRRSSSWGFANC